MPELLVEGLRKQLGTTEALRGVSLSLEAGEVVALLGPSGSGKTTLLRCVAGLERPDAGRIVLGSTTLFDASHDVPAEKRGLGLVFQSYALWPHRTVFGNVAYALRLRGTPRDEIERRVDEVLDRLGLAAMRDRLPHQLSGGQQQRVALARALVYNPPLLLLDEPLSNLDAKLRDEARAWLRQLILRLRLSALYVTHDQVEAMSVADRVVLLNTGQVEQIGTPTEIYDNPQTLFAADFMGTNNVLRGTLARVEGSRALLQADGWQLWGTLKGERAAGDAAIAIVRVEAVRLAGEAAENRLQLPMRTALYVGGQWELIFGDKDESIRVWSAERPADGAHTIQIPEERLWIF